MSHDLTLKEIQKEWHGTLKGYLMGFIGSLMLTIVSFSLVIWKVLPEQTLMHVLITLALCQAVCQLIFFLHMLQEEKPRWGAIIFGFMVAILLFIAIGSLWVIRDLNQRMMPDMNMNKEKPHD